MIKKGNPDIWEVSEGGGCLVALGAVLVAGGAYGILGALDIVRSVIIATPAMVIIIGATMILVGSVFILGRRGITIDRRLRTVVMWKKCVVRFRAEELQLANYHGLELRSKQMEDEKTSPYTIYAVCLGSGGERAPVYLSAHTEIDKVRKTADELSAFLNMPVNDLTGVEED